MRALIQFAAAAVAGTLVMFYLDPVSGSRRRAGLRASALSRRHGFGGARNAASEPRQSEEGELAGPGGGIGSAP
ncbi:hypothetical protein [Paraburkholderia lycopersici]|uniref:Uncharacterized protein n=1 Tax=Paraburkholderia lycopersici TaxID=416944 RepID=A0A1G7ART6_9BURK|nr:hypothetical protein [Paraburkholderia lycopersici]SDE17523.1 hypothetical protein SAMN05421548_13550 [Paraburkholderia lycopersici]